MEQQLASNQQQFAGNWVSRISSEEIIWTLRWSRPSSPRLNIGADSANDNSLNPEFFLPGPFFGSQGLETKTHW